MPHRPMIESQYNLHRTLLPSGDAPPKYFPMIIKSLRDHPDRKRPRSTHDPSSVRPLIDPVRQVIRRALTFVAP